MKLVLEMIADKVEKFERTLNMILQDISVIEGCANGKNTKVTYKDFYKLCYGCIDKFMLFMEQQESHVFVAESGESIYNLLFCLSEFWYRENNEREIFDDLVLEDVREIRYHIAIMKRHIKERIEIEKTT